MTKRFAQWLQECWYRDMYVSSMMVPLSMLYDDVMRVRKFLYRINILKKTRLSVPVIVVGNITVGGTGKTPLTLWLAEYLVQQGYKPGIITRGYGGVSEVWPQKVGAFSQPQQVGDEAVLLATNSKVPVYVGPDRVASGKMLLEQTDCDVIISDDGLQHYALERDIEIAVIDGQRRFGNQYTLPCGPLREPISRLNHVDLIVVNGNPQEANELSMQIQGNQLVNLKTHEQIALKTFHNKSCHVIAGIGNPQRFFDHLSSQGILIDAHAFQDHHVFTVEDIQFGDEKPVLMTEKDAVKCFNFASDKHWYLPVNAKPEPLFIDKLSTLIKEKACG